MFDMRAYIVSLIAVFLALAIGILLGTVVVDKGVLVEQQKSLVGKIQNQINELRQRNNELRDAVKRSDEFAARVFPDATANRLAGKHVLLVVTPGASARIKKELIDTIGFAGGNLSVMTITSSTLQLEDQRVRDQVVAYFPGEDMVQKGYLRRVAQELAVDLRGEKEFAFSGLLNSLNLIIVEGPWPSKPDTVVVMGDEAKNTNSFLTSFIIPFLGKLREVTIPVVVTELEGSEASQIPKYRQAGATATVDNVDTIYGKTALVYALNGASGNFGTKKTADRLLPPL
jgi:hypothetical protein